MGNYISVDDLTEIENSLVRRKRLNSFVKIYNSTVTLYNFLIIILVMLIIYLIYYINIKNRLYK